MSNIKKLLGARIREIRKSKGFTQEKTAELVGIEPASLSNIENGKFYPTPENLEKIASVLETNPFELYKFEHKAPKVELAQEVYVAMQNNKDLAELIYKFYSLVK